MLPLLVSLLHKLSMSTVPVPECMQCGMRATGCCFPSLLLLMLLQMLQMHYTALSGTSHKLYRASQPCRLAHLANHYLHQLAYCLKFMWQTQMQKSVCLLDRPYEGALQTANSGYMLSKYMSVVVCRAHRVRGGVAGRWQCSGCCDHIRLDRAAQRSQQWSC